MKTIERVMRVMTHVNIGATLGMTAWVLWSGYQVVSGAWTLPRVSPGPAERSGPAARPATLPCCLVPAEKRGQGTLQVRAPATPATAAAAESDA